MSKKIKQNHTYGATNNTLWTEISFSFCPVSVERNPVLGSSRSFNQPRPRPGTKKLKILVFDFFFFFFSTGLKLTHERKNSNCCPWRLRDCEKLRFYLHCISSFLSIICVISNEFRERRLSRTKTDNRSLVIWPNWPKNNLKLDCALTFPMATYDTKAR